nr:MAG TPA: hypothetical protein [Caudoviricetes sp.]
MLEFAYSHTTPIRIEGVNENVLIVYQEPLLPPLADISPKSKSVIPFETMDSNDDNLVVNVTIDEEASH